MVDFQSRDTRRGFSSDDEEDEEDEAETDADETGTDRETETDDREATESDGESEGERSETADAAGATERAEPSAAEATGTGEDASAADAERTLETTSATESPDPDERVSERDDGVTPTADSTGTPTESRASDADDTAGTADPDSPAAQRRNAATETAVDAALVTVGTTTERGEDPTGEALAAAIEAAGYDVTARERLRRDYDGIQRAVNALVRRDDVGLVVTAGGVGVTADDVTIEAVHPLFEKSLPGFGEVFRSFLFDEVGTGIVSIRATAGIADGTPVFCLPADEGAAGVAIDEIIAAEAPGLLGDIEG
ncbi:molybdopterin-binding protein [Haloarcula nitratireducens]|uniref:Molybdenum cofactor biosynthesis protein MoaB n=1 Tax=Haloarcula nitratireducens TaxID=2487749 RepID=A0AAW4PBP6_9EURY|nr:molybdopterin-binding protein [Halomicroarcula nitratireducens]MBX0295090.1 molybdenum cofactor biosynthesis protein MoaB [Halomicroarcula nitratireducens]